MAQTINRCIITRNWGLGTGSPHPIFLGSQVLSLLCVSPFSQDGLRLLQPVAAIVPNYSKRKGLFASCRLKNLPLVQLVSLGLVLIPEPLILVGDDWTQSHIRG